ncbi:protein of unknown function DUF116 [Methanohalobium evestigatum Z-7303]|uniref:Polyprenyl synthetase n=1 Tax=Methanohalobium evestigatum (strain ATCC BAA-1072 / DSM 3721 / NBRC 107634 / OCM 161 / Z-7303) TaxID=644295 RepID=D7E8B5_METEZ|nr:protein of unknown function DUF116 [Methanohalobium evestigatum Z-7303]
MLYNLIGIALFFFIIVSIILTTTALLVGRINLNRNVWLAGFFVNILDFFYLPIKILFQKFSDSSKLDKLMVSLRNTANKSSFKKTRNRLILAPHCMRSLDCPASSTRFGIKCISCNKCILASIKKDAENYNYKLYIVAGSSYIRHIVKKEPVDGALLLACYYELNKVMRYLKQKNIVTYGVPLLEDGCYNTTIDYNNLKKTLNDLKMSEESKLPSVTAKVPHHVDDAERLIK